jgi:hypothetical protein
MESFRSVRESAAFLIVCGMPCEVIVTSCSRSSVLIRLTACDETGKPLFTLDQAEALAEKSNSAIDRVYDKAAALNKLRKKDNEVEKKESAIHPSDALLTA